MDYIADTFYKEKEGSSEPSIIEYDSDPEPSYMTNCFIRSRKGDPRMFTIDSHGHMRFCLDRYAIIPMEEYSRLSNLQIPE